VLDRSIGYLGCIDLLYRDLAIADGLAALTVLIDPEKGAGGGILGVETSLKCGDVVLEGGLCRLWLLRMRERATSKEKA
jgi:hypothetical protein